jgi:serine/threonine protein kinase
MSTIPALGTVLAGKYRIESVLGAGGMGVVLAATHVHLEERVAIKLLNPETAARPEAITRFVREARVAMRLRSEHVVRILDVGMLPTGAPFIVMEYLNGRDLGAVLREDGRLERARAVDYVLQVCEAIAEAHLNGVVHRDLKPANLFLTKRVDGIDCVKVLDFGVSKIAADLSSSGDVLSSTDSTSSKDQPQSAEPATRSRARPSPS